MRFLLNAVPQLLTVDQSTPTKDIVEAVKRKYGQEIAIRQAQKLKTQLCPRDQDQISSGTVDIAHNSIEPNTCFHDPVRPQGSEPSPTANAMELDRRLGQGEGSARHDKHACQTNYRSTLPTTAHALASSTNQDRLTSHADNDMGSHLSLLPPLLGRTGSGMDDPASETNYGISSRKTPQEVRDEAAVLFQKASSKLQEACFLHAEASRLFASVANA